MSYKRSLSTESSDDDSVKKEDIVPAQRRRTVTTGTSSQYSSASSSAPICESLSESDSDSRDQPESTKRDRPVKYTQGSGDEEMPTGSEFMSKSLYQNPTMKMKMMRTIGYQPMKGFGLSESDSDSRDQPESTKRDRPVKYTQGSGDEEMPTGSEFMSNGNNPKMKMKMMRTIGYQPMKGFGLSESESDSPSYSRDQLESHTDMIKLDRPVKYTQGSGDEEMAAGSELTSNGNNPVMKMMRIMGYQPGKGLGKFAQGRTEPVEASTQKGRRGLGLKPSTLGEVPKDFVWRKEAEKIVATEDVEWLPPSNPECLSLEILEQWLEKGSRKITIDDETNYVHPDVLHGVLISKSVFDDLDAEALRRARTKSNPYETIGSVIFLNRAAVKMANMDAVFDFMFTEPKAVDGSPLVKKNELLYFADVCAGPGGFSEYVLYRKKWRAKGFGFTLKGSNDFKLSDFFAGPPETFSPYYGKADNGDIFNPENLETLQDHVLRQTNELGVHFLMGDGGFSVDGQENIQEILSKQLYLCQCIAALMLVRPGGNFVVKLFDIFTPFSVGLVYLMYRSFEQVCIHKPHTSRPANSERYLICKWKRPESDVIQLYLISVNKFLWENRDPEDEDIVALVPMYIMKDDKEFFNYVYKSNNTLGERQINNLLKIAAFCKDKNLTEPTQVEMRKECLQLWKLEEKVRTAPRKGSPDDTLNRILSLMQTRPPESSDIQNFKRNVLNKPATRVQDVKHLGLLRGVYDCHFVTMNTNVCKFYLGLGGNHVYELDETRWQHLTETKVTMPAMTLLYGEIVKELRGERGTQMMTRALHVIDAVCLGGEDISHKSLIDRHQLCELFCAALDKPFDSNILPIRCKPLMELENFSREMNQYQFRFMKNGHKAVTTAIPTKTQSNVDLYHVVESLLFLQSLKEPWQATMSKSTNTKYFFKPLPDKKFHSEYHRLPEACLNTINSFLKRKMWCWEPASAVYQNMLTGGLNRGDMEEFVKKHLV